MSKRTQQHERRELRRSRRLARRTDAVKRVIAPVQIQYFVAA